MQRKCDQCGKAYEAKTAKSRFHSAKCRLDYHNAEKRSKPVPQIDGAISAAVRAELKAVDRTDSPGGLLALELARRLDASANEASTTVIALTKQLESTLARATANARRPDSPVDKMRDELAERRARRGA